MAFASSVLIHSIRAKGIFGSYFVKWSARSCTASSFNRIGLLRTATTASEAMPNRESSSPWLMLPPEFESGKMSYKFYSLADNKVQTHPSDVIRDLRLTCKGSSHGYLALFSSINEEITLYNPVSRRYINLPSTINVPRLPDHTMDVTKVILTCSPDEDEENCRAFMINGWGTALAFCCPGRSNKWTVFRESKKLMYNDCVYSDRLKLLFVLAPNYLRVETWDLGDLSSPKLIKVNSSKFFTEVERFLWCRSEPHPHLVVAGEDVLIVIQYVLHFVGPDGSCFGVSDEHKPDHCRNMTIRFDVLKYDRKKGKFKYVDGSSSSCLGGFAIFVGKHSHTVAIPASRFPELKPDSIYFTDLYLITKWYEDDPDYGQLFGGHDIGIYNYRDKTVSSCYYPCDAASFKTLCPAPMWFFPN